VNSVIGQPAKLTGAIPRSVFDATDGIDPFVLVLADDQARVLGLTVDEGSRE
jgi:hypothetical protein